MLSKRLLKYRGLFDPKCNLSRSHGFWDCVVLLKGKKKLLSYRQDEFWFLLAVMTTSSYAVSTSLGPEHEPCLWSVELWDSPSSEDHGLAQRGYGSFLGCSLSLFSFMFSFLVVAEQ